MNVHKVILTIIDFDDIGADEVSLVIEQQRYPNRCIRPDVFGIETVDIGEWDDDNPLNNSETQKDALKNIFPSLNENFNEENIVTEFENIFGDYQSFESENTTSDYELLLEGFTKGYKISKGVLSD